MKCDWVKSNVLFYVYNELQDDARYELEQHLARCADCTAELKVTRNFHATLSQLAVEEPHPNFLTDSRMRLQEALETAEQGGFWQRLIFEPANWFRQLRMSPALAAMIFMVGFGGGIGAAYNYFVARVPNDIAQVGQPSESASPIEASAVTGIRSITQAPGTNEVNIKYDTVSTKEEKGSLSDARIQQLLLFAARNNFNSGVRLDSVDLLTQAPNNTHIQEVLMYSLQNDTNPGVRLKAIEGLGGFVMQDTRVRNAVLQALINDSNLGVRVQALRLVEPLKADSTVRGVLTRLATSDQNASIREQARNTLAQTPEMD